MSVAGRPADPFAGTGEVRELCREIDWAATSLGPVDKWSPVLRKTVETCLESPFPINLWCGPELVLIYNDAYRPVLGGKHPRALGRPGYEVWAEIWDEIAPMFPRIRAGGPPVYADDAPFVVQRTSEARDKESADPNAWYTFSLSAVRDENGEVVAFLNIVSESTGRVLAERAMAGARARAEHAEARIREVFAQAPSFLAVLRGPSHIFEFVNAAYYQLIGHRDVIGRPAVEALPEIRGQGFEQLLDQVLEGGAPYVGREAPIMLSRTPDSEPEQRYVDFVYYPVTEADGARTGVVAHGSDVTEHVLARREAQAARAEAEQANKAKSQFLANMSHEIRTPINAIIGYTDLLDLGIAGPITERQKEQLERVRLSGQHLLGLIEDILDLAKAEAGHIEVGHERALAVNAIAAALALIAPQAAQRGISIEDPCSDDASIAYAGDEDRVRQILVNLLSNAVKFTESGGTIRVSCGTSSDVARELEVEQGGPYTYIRVEDTGVGIDESQIDAVFRPFLQVETGHTRTRGGTGLGLTISRQLARLMGGDLTLESKPGVGSAFTLWLPTDQSMDSSLDKSLIEKTREAPPQYLAEVGAAVQDQIQEILESFAARIRNDPVIAPADSLSGADLEDHTSSFLADIAQSLVSLEENGVEGADLLRDGTEIQQFIAKLHGAQRARLGWSEDGIVREFAILRRVVESAVRARVDSAADLGDALGILMRFLDHAEHISLMAWRRAAAGKGAGTGAR
ncbi:MAG TPA: ATP-binding protein [Longimicrobiaceae bacterium]|nr:ATP-binding protein [Longimicrobiaceae bacterium]